VEDKDKSKMDKGKEKRIAATGVKDLDMKKLEGEWFEVASSAAIHQIFTKGCACSRIEMKKLAENKLHVMAACHNETSNEIVSVNGTLTQIKPNENKALFHLAFTEKNATVPVAISPEEQKKVEEAKKGKTVEKKDEHLSANAIVLKADDKFDSILMGGPEIDALWILSKTRKIDDKMFNDFQKFGEDNGFSGSKLKKADLSKCEELEKKKA